MLGHYTDDTLDAAACLWGTILEMRHATTSRNPEEASLARDIAASFDRLGMTVLRHHILGWTEHVEAAWYDAEPTYEKSFDQHFVPEWILENIDWSSDDSPSLRETEPAPLPPGYDVAITLVLNAVVRTGGGEPVALAAAKQLLNRIEERHSCAAGSDIGVPAVTEFSIGSAGEAIDIDPISDEFEADALSPSGQPDRHS
ncbi:hypothetical protein AWL63_18155 [Sphingomonas panacis]|uniref:Uncharacterized protein n=1 Tax=Sphingomonas panacis TaxID=1560345 RepID=A0A1B3ZDR7_9SPHN|nr:hypothetical protein [Sphingomonas panacis]AOH85570.1 hypothetical protein AWL63_18155 [Sphingomonas panacis]